MVGSCNVDVVVEVPHLPAPGETVLGGDRRDVPGGKGANQAVAAGRLGTRVHLVGAVGDDPAGQLLLDALAAGRVDTSEVSVLADVASGTALIAVDGAGENTIVVAPGANARIAPADVAASPAVRSAQVVAVQLEVSDGVVAAAVGAATGAVVLTPAPARALAAGVLAEVDVIVPNRVELGQLLGVAPPATVDDAARAAGRLRAGGRFGADGQRIDGSREASGPRAVVVTLGDDGVVVVDGEAATPVHLRAPDVVAIDTTGAGDAFCGALCDGLADGRSLRASAERAVRAAAISVTRAGAQTSPSAAELDDAS